MKRLAPLLLLWMLTFALGKLAFIAFCHGSEAVSLGDVAAIFWHGLPMDLSTTAYLLLLPWLCCWIASNWAAAWRGLRWVLIVFHALAALAVVACIVGDIVIYPFWGFKLDATIWTYIDSPKDAVASVSAGFVLLALLIFLALSTGLFWLLCRSMGLFQRWNKAVPPVEHASSTSGTCPHDRTCVAKPLGVLLRNLGYLLLGALLFVCLRGGVTESTMNVGNAYFSDRQFLNHAAVNPAFSLLASSQKVERFDLLYRSMPDAEASSLLAGLYPITSPVSEDSEDSDYSEYSDYSESSEYPLNPSSLLRTSRPNILLLFWEGCGGQLTAALGGPDGAAAITPNLDSLAREAVFFSELRANSFRTDRGTLSTLSGQLAYPTHSLMKMAARASHLPSIARSLEAAGYSTSFTYGGDINFTNMKGYLLSTGFQHITADTDFSRAERSSAKWGVCDSLLFLRLFDDLLADWETGNSRNPGQSGPSPFFATALTLSSHEPWDVPASFRRPSDVDERVASFRYTDHHLGRFLRRLRQSDLWDNLLVIILPDHGVHAGGVSRHDDPRFFHIPMIWTGGAVAAPYRIPTLMNQSDLPATLLAQLDLPHADFPWSRDVLSPAYARTFSYSAINDGFCLVSPTSTVLFDNKSQQMTSYGNSLQADSLAHLGKAILQRSYDQLEELH